jgi:hypothetical protein
MADALTLDVTYSGAQGRARPLPLVQAPAFFTTGRALLPSSDSAAFALCPLCVARDFWWREHEYRRWGGHTPWRIATSSVLGAPVSLIRPGLSPQSSGLFHALSWFATTCYRFCCRGSCATSNDATPFVCADTAYRDQATEASPRRLGNLALLGLGYAELRIYGVLRSSSKSFKKYSN